MLVLVMVVGFSFPQMAHASPNEVIGNVTAGSSIISPTTKNALLASRGKEFRAEIDAAKVEVDWDQRVQHFTGICSKYLPTGMGFEDVEILLRAAGVKAPLAQSERYLRGAGSHRLDFSTAITLYHSWVASAILVIYIRAVDPESKHKVVDRVECHLLRKAL